VFERRHLPGDPDYLPTLLIKMSPWTAGDLADIRRFFSFAADGEPVYAQVEDPAHPNESFLPDVFYSGELPASLLRAATYDPSAVTDDRPDFNFLRRSLGHLASDRATGLNDSTAEFLNGQLRGHEWLAMDRLHLMVAGAAAVFYGVLLVLVPMWLSPVGRTAWTGKGPALTYFSLLGLAFIMIELLFIQMFMKLIGYPPYAVVTVISVMLTGAGLGSMSSRSLAGPSTARWHFAFAGIITTGLTVRLTAPSIAHHFMASGTPIRILVAALMIGPVALFMGMPFPLGILELGAKPRGAIAWAWSMNGLCTTFGSVATVLLCLRYGFRATELVALGLYSVAWVALGVLRQGNRLEQRLCERQARSLPKVDRPRPAAATWVASRAVRD
jgi:hypothetical protein